MSRWIPQASPFSIFDRKLAVPTVPVVEPEVWRADIAALRANASALETENSALRERAENAEREAKQERSHMDCLLQICKMANPTSHHSPFVHLANRTARGAPKLVVNNPRGAT